MVNYFRIVPDLVAANPIITMLVFILAAVVVLVAKVAALRAIFNPGGGTTHKERLKKIHQPEAEGRTGKDPVENARLYLVMYNQQARGFELKFHATFVVVVILSLMATTLSGKLQQLGIYPIRLAEVVAALIGIAHFFGWKPAWKNCRSTCTLLSTLVRNWDQNVEEFERKGILVEKRQLFAKEFDSILNGQHDAFLKILEAQELRALNNKPADLPPQSPAENKKD
jgi:hypothetical protein